MAGCYVLDGFVGRNHTARLIRDTNTLVWEGKISTLKRFKDDVKEVKSTFECGIALDGFNDIRENDIIETYSLEEIEREI